MPDTDKINYDIEKVSSRPWRIKRYHHANHIYIEDAGKSQMPNFEENYDHQIVCSTEERSLRNHSLENMQHLIHCVNAHDDLQAKADIFDELVNTLDANTNLLEVSQGNASYEDDQAIDEQVVNSYALVKKARALKSGGLSNETNQNK